MPEISGYCSSLLPHGGGWMVWVAWWEGGHNVGRGQLNG